MNMPIPSKVRTMSRTKKIAAAFGTAGVAVVTVGTVAALWTADASGNSSSQALTAQTLTITAATPTADLYPGFTQGDLFFDVGPNNNPYPVRFTAMTVNSVTSGNPTNCPSSNVTATGKSGLTLDVAAGATARGQSIADVVSMATAAPDGCQGVTFTIGISLTGTQTTS